MRRASYSSFCKEHQVAADSGSEKETHHIPTKIQMAQTSMRICDES